MLRKYVTGGKPPSSDHGPVRIPSRKGDVGFDLCAKEEHICRAGVVTWIPTGVAIDSRDLWYMITGRSSLHRRGAFVPLGIIDAGYQGELVVPVVSLNADMKIQAGEYIAQCIFCDIFQPTLRLVEHFAPSDRGDRGFGSTERT